MKDIHLEGNNGGDYIRITQTREQEKNSCCTVEVGHCCVVTMDHQVPVEFVTSLFTSFMLTNKEGFSRKAEDNLADFAKEVMVYNSDFTSERASRIKKL